MTITEDERDQLREWLDDHEITLTIAHGDVARLKAKLARLEAKAAEVRDQIDDAEAETAELQRAHDLALEDYNERGGDSADA